MKKIKHIKPYIELICTRWGWRVLEVLDSKGVLRVTSKEKLKKANFYNDAFFYFNELKVVISGKVHELPDYKVQKEGISLKFELKLKTK